MRAGNLGLLLLALLGACGRTASKGTPTDVNVAGTSSIGGTSSGVAGAPSDCDGSHVGPAPLTHLRSREYLNSVRALFPGYEPPLDPPVDGAPTDPATAQWVSDVHRIAHEVARDVSADPTLLRAVTDCEPEGNVESCRDHFIDHFASLAFRRPTTPEERAELGSVFATGQRLGRDFANGVRAVLEVALQSPELLYLPELGNGNEQNGNVSLTPYETATRVAYFVTGSSPDPELRGAADRDELNAEGVAKQARRLLGSAASRAQVQAFLRERYYLGRQFGRDEDAPTPAIRELALEETDRFIADVTFDGAGTFRALLTEPTTWVNEALAQHYGYAGVSGNEFRKLQLDPQQRGGLFTQASFLASGADGVVRPIRRAMTVLPRLLCHPIGFPPPDVEFPPPDASMLSTTRETLTRFTAGASCQPCHEVLNPVGFAFEHYDTLGKFRDTERDRPIDSSGELVVTDAGGPFVDARELMTRIAESQDGEACFVRQWQELAYRRELEPADGCSETSLRDGFDATDGNVVELIVALAQSDNLRFRQKSELKGRD